MTIDTIITSYLWLLTRWWFWVSSIIFWILIWFLFKQRFYKEINDKLLIRHGKLGKWIDIKEHLQQEHPIEWAMLQEQKKKEQ